MAGRDDEIADAVVTVRPDLTGFKKELQRQLKTELAGIEPTIKVKLVADKTGFAKSVREQLALVKTPEYKIKLVADANGFLTSVRNELRKQKLLKQPEYKVKVTADTGRGGIGGRGGDTDRGGRDGANRAVEKLLRDQYLRRARNVFEEITREQLDSWRRGYEQQDKMDRDALARRLSRTRDVNERLVHDVQSAERAAYAERDRMEQDHLRRVERAERESNIRRARNTKSRSDAFKSPKIIDFGGEGIRPMNLLYGAVAALTPALLAMSTSALQASTSVAALGAAGIGAALGISALAISFSSISDVLKLRQSAKNSALAKTAKSVGVSAAEQAGSLRDLANAQRDEKTAYAAIHDARREAVRDLQDLRQAVIDLDNEYKSNKLSVAEAEQNEAATNRNFFATALDRARAHQDTLDARSRLSGTELQRKQKREDLARSVKSGVEGSDKVLQARERARDARDRRLDLQSQRSKSAAAGLDGTSAAAAQLAQKLKDLSPAARDMYNWFDANDKKLKDLRRTIEQGTLPGFTTFLREISKAPKGGKSTLQVAAEYAAQLGGILGKYAGRFGKITNTPLFRENMATIQKNNAEAFDTLGSALEHVMRPLLRIFTKASPLLGKFADKMLDLATRFDTFIEKADKNGTLKKWFDDTAEQANEWWRILSNAFGFLQGIFTAALPSGGSLVKAFADYMERLANWSKSSRGQEEIKGFFDKIASLPYEKIATLLVQLGELFLAKHAASWIRANPLFTAIGILVAAHPAGAVQLLEALTDFVEVGVRMLSANPELTAMLLSLVALGKLNKATGGALFAVTGLDKLKDMLRGKFKVLDKFLGGGAATSVMNVRAAVVHLYGPVTGGAPGGRPTPTPVPAGGAKPGRLAPGSGGNLALTAGLAVGAVLVGQIDSTGATPFQKGVKDAVTGTLSGAALGTMIGGPIGAAVGAAIGSAVGLAVGKWQERQEKMATTQGREDLAYNTLKNADLAENQPLLSLGDAVKLKPIQDYIKARKENVAAAVENERALHGEAAARRLQVVETQKSANTLARLLEKYTGVKGGADKYARAAFDLSGAIYNANMEMRNAQKELGKTGKKAEATTAKIGVLSERLNEVSGKKEIVLTIAGEEKVFASLETAAAYQQLIKRGEEPNQGNLNKQKKAFKKADPDGYDPFTGAKRSAAGGKVGGWSPNAKADNIPAWLTADEWVQPVASVKYYGTDFMEAVRTRRFPKFAAGGQVDKWPFSVQMPPNAATAVTGPYDPESFSGPDNMYIGKAVKGLGRVAGLGERIMGAVLDAKKKFPGLTVYSGYRAGSRTVTGNASYHGKRRAVDLPPSMALFEYLKQRWDGAIRELIFSPANNRQVWNGKPHMFSSAVRKGHWDHVHLALAQGGLVQPKKFDTGGVLPPGYTLAFNGTGRNETVRTDRQERAVQQGPVRLDRRDITMLAAAVANTGAASVNMDGRRVAELTNRYNYLPAGV